MILRSQRVTVLVAILIPVLLIALFGAAAYLALSRDLAPPMGSSTSVPRWLLFPAPQDPQALLLNLVASLGVLLLSALLANLGVRGLYARTAAPEILFTMLFFASLCLEALRFGNLVLRESSASAAAGPLLSRVVLFGRLFGLMCILAASLYAAGMKYNQYPILIAGILVLSFTLAGTLPLDGTLLEATLLHRLGDRKGYFFVTILLAALSVIDYLIAVRVRRSRRFLALAAAAVCLLLGRELLQRGIAPLPTGLGALLLAGGYALFVRNIGVFYLWV
ncbi:MAG: hypothetical protein JW820_09460 [Spirochaetales bacterium]|nr:hypothetical protein [Spirochaetales bacterium]